MIFGISLKAFGIAGAFAGLFAGSIVSGLALWIVKQIQGHIAAIEAAFHSIPDKIAALLLKVHIALPEDFKQKVADWIDAKVKYAETFVLDPKFWRQVIRACNPAQAATVIATIESTLAKGLTPEMEEKFGQIVLNLLPPDIQAVANTVKQQVVVRAVMNKQVALIPAEYHISELELTARVDAAASGLKQEATVNKMRTPEIQGLITDLKAQIAAPGISTK